MKRKLRFNSFIAIPGSCNYKNRLKKLTKQTHFENAAEKLSHRNYQGYEVVID